MELLTAADKTSALWVVNLTKIYKKNLKKNHIKVLFVFSPFFPMMSHQLDGTALIFFVIFFIRVLTRTTEREEGGWGATVWVPVCGPPQL